MGDLPRYWKKIDEPKAGTYELVMLAGYDHNGDTKDRRVLYVCKSLKGYLNEAFDWTQVGKVWEIDIDYKETSPESKRTEEDDIDS